MRLLFLVFLALIFPTAATASDASWAPVKVSAWKGKQAGSGRYDLAAGLVEADVDLAPLAGQWVRLGATTAADAPDFSAWIQVFDANNKIISRVLPTTCELAGARKRCHTVAWIRPDGARLRLGFYSNFVPVEIIPDGAEWTRAQAATAQTLARYDALRSTVRARYFRSSSFDWIIPATERGALDAPDGIDPVPLALLDLIARLPENKHTQLMVDNQSAPITMPLELPACTARADGTWTLRMPATPGKLAENARYVDAAHACIAKAPAGKWLVDLREHSGGNTMLTFAALAPVLGTGDMMMYVYPDQSSVKVALTPDTVTVAGNVSVQWERKTVPFAGNVSFLIGPGCMSACESVAIAVKAKYKTIGQPTGGYTSVNDTIRINQQMQLALTVGMQADPAGKTYESVMPDKLLDETN